MDAILLMVGLFVGYIVAYRTYGRWLAQKVFRVRQVCLMPSEEFRDGVDYVPTRRGVVFGHHFTSIAGTGPIVGPAIAIIWGWVPAVVWVFVGSIFMGAVHDFGAMIVSLRNQGHSIADIASRYINRRVQTIMFCVVFLELLIVIAIFGLVIAFVFKQFPQSVFPVWCEVPIAMALGWAIYRRNWKVVPLTILAVTLMYVTVVLGHWIYPTIGKTILGLPDAGFWTIILLIYAFFASTLPVTALLQPRDYINAWQLFVAMALLVAGVVGAGLFGDMSIVAPPVQWAPTGAPPMWPFLFIMIACGAISGFHCLVASGTSSKQLACEPDAYSVGYGSMLMESALSILVILAVAAGIGMTGPGAWQAHYASWSAAEGLAAKIAAFVDGSANMIATLGLHRDIALIVMGVFVASFAGTTLDTATRLQRYVIGELGERVRMPILTNRWLATAVAVITAGALAFSTGWTGAGALKLWPMFGALNQTLAALALLIITVYLRGKGRWTYLVTGIPCLFMLAMTLWSMGHLEVRFVRQHMDYLHGVEKSQPTIQLIVINALMLILATWMTVEVLAHFRRAERTAEQTEQPLDPSDADRPS